jgi:UDP-N-acetylglucosamine diphosphorylase/glucosamine-1-phosphate N-acetyltransferase
MSYSLYFIDDGTARSWEPFSLTRPAGELLFGTFLLRERGEKYWGAPCQGHLTSESLRGFLEPGSPPVVGLEGIPSDRPRILQSSRAALVGSPPPHLVESGQAGPALKETVTLRVGGQVAGWVLPAGAPNPGPENIMEGVALPASREIELEGTVLGAPWDLMAENARQLEEDIPRFFPGYAVDELPGCHILGNELVSMGSGVVVEPGSVFDATGGPIRLSDGVVVRAHTRVAGPAFIGPGCTVLGGSLEEVSIGPISKVRGEIESSVILGYSNKAHDGFLGHAYLGRWVNLGALTTNSDLKNNYGPVRVGSRHGPRDTGLMKVGCFLGDHVKTGIGTLLNTGTVVGTGSNIFGGGMPPAYVPPFSWGAGEDLTEFRLEKFLEVATRAMGRRGMVLDEGMAEVLERAWEETRILRHPELG